MVGPIGEQRVLTGYPSDQLPVAVPEADRLAWLNDAICFSFNRFYAYQSGFSFMFSAFSRTPLSNGFVLRPFGPRRGVGVSEYVRVAIGYSDGRANQDIEMLDMSVATGRVRVWSAGGVSSTLDVYSSYYVEPVPPLGNVDFGVYYDDDHVSVRVDGESLIRGSANASMLWE